MVPKHDSAVRLLAKSLIKEDVVKRHGVMGWKRVHPGKVLEVRSTAGLSVGPKTVALIQDVGDTVRRQPAEGPEVGRVLGVFCRRASEVVRGLRTPALAEDPWDVVTGSFCWAKSNTLYRP